MRTSAIRLDPRDLGNPDADLSYVLPDLIEERSAGQVRSDGHDYEDDDVMVIFLTADEPAKVEGLIRDLLDGIEVLGKELRGPYGLRIDP
jgi:hypothetical protein